MPNLKHPSLDAALLEVDAEDAHGKDPVEAESRVEPHEVVVQEGHDGRRRENVEADLQDPQQRKNHGHEPN